LISVFLRQKEGSRREIPFGSENKKLVFVISAIMIFIGMKEEQAIQGTPSKLSPNI
jgi:hypothetical protein